MEAGDLLWQPLKGAAEREDIFIKLLRGHCYTNWAKCAEACNSNFSFAKKMKAFAQLFHCLWIHLLVRCNVFRFGARDFFFLSKLTTLS